MLNEANLATFLIDPLTPEEEMIDLRTAHLRFDISLLAERLAAATDWLTQYPDTRHLRVEEPGALGEVDPFRSLLRRIFLPIDMHESQKASPPLRGAAAALADLSFSARRSYYRARLILVGDVLLLAADVAGKRYAKAPGGSGGSRPWSANVDEAEEPEAVRQVMDVRIAIKENGVQVFRGPLRDSASVSFEKLNRVLPKGFVPLVQEDEQLGAKIALIPKPAEEDVSRKPVRPWLHWLLFGLTIITTTWAGASHQGVDLAQEPGRFTVGLSYSIGLLLILGVHELGRFFMARRYGMDVTPPYFIPVPFGLGTFGAFIQMRSAPANRKNLFDVAVAGPLAGFVIAVPALLIGLRFSSITAGSDGAASNGFLHGATFFFALPHMKVSSSLRPHPRCANHIQPIFR
jgi:membrane-associated protease RseP (regulator of RpoE activity)